MMCVKVLKSKTENRIYQGEIYKDIECFEFIVEKKGLIEISKIMFPYVVVLTQDCDLRQDFKFRYGRKKTQTQDKYLLSVLVAPLYNAEHVYSGEHWSRLDSVMEPINRRRTAGDRLRANQTPRYHYLKFPADIRIVDSVIDFKHYFSVNVKYLKKVKSAKFICRLATLFREDLSIRFSNYLSRIGLPE